MTDYNRSQGGAALGGRLRRLSERVDRDANRVYLQLGVRFEQRWMGVLNQLDLRGPMSVNDLAATLGITHPSVSQTRASLRAAGLISARADPKDGRRSVLRLTANGKALVKRLRSVWSALAEVARALNDEAGDTVSALGRLEDALDRQSIFERVRARMKR